MGDSPVRAFTVGAVVALATGVPDFCPQAKLDELVSHLLGRTVEVSKLHGTEILKARRVLLSQHGALAQLKPKRHDGDNETYGPYLVWLSGYLTAVEQLYGVPAEKTMHGGEGTWIFVRSGADWS